MIHKLIFFYHVLGNEISFATFFFTLICKLNCLYENKIFIYILLKVNKK